MSCRIVIQDRFTKKKKAYSLNTFKDESELSFDSKNQIKFYEAYVHKISSKDSSIRVQRKIKCKTLEEAKRVEKKLIQKVSELIYLEESKGSTWGVIVDLWFNECVKDYLDTGLCWNPLTGRKVKYKTVKDNYALVKSYTKDWLKLPASELTRLHGKSIIRKAEEVFENYGSVRKLRTAIRAIYNFAIEEGIIIGQKKSPVCGIGIILEPEDSDPDILSLNEVQILLSKAKELNHPWYPVWLHALSTGMRSSELYALRKDNVLFDRGIIKVSESWNWELDQPKETKAGYWRPAPIAKDLLVETKKLYNHDSSEFLFPRFPEWERGEQAKVLRSFCDSIGIKSVKFHALRACFATHLLASGVDRATVMRIGGWKTFKSFEVYVRLSGIDEKGATDGMVGKLLKTDQDVVDHGSDIWCNSAA